MSYKPKVFYFVVIVFGFAAIFSLTGCERIYQPNDKIAETQIINLEPKSEIISPVESAETPEYKNLKMQIQAAENELAKIKNKRAKLLEIFQVEAVEARKISAQLEVAEKQLNRLKSSADKEAAKFGRKPEYFPF